MTLRSVVPGDKDALRRFFNGLSGLARYQRFFSGMPAIPEALLERFSDPDPDTHIGLAVFANERVVADGQLIRSEEGEAEIAIAVSDEWQGRGIGRQLLRTLIAEGRQRGWTSIRADYFSDNRRMISLLRDAGFTLTRTARSAGFGAAQLAL